MGRRVLRAVVGSVAALLAAFALVELWARVAGAPPRVLVVHKAKVNGYRVTPDGIVLFPNPRFYAPCSARRPGVPTIAFYGSSITYGEGNERNLALPHQVEVRLEASQGARCSDDFSQPGYGPEQLWATARETIPVSRPEIAVWELWDARKHYTVVGDTAYDARGRVIDAAGVPVLPFVSQGLGDFLFHRSWAYEYAALALAPFDPRGGPDDDRIAWMCANVLPRIVGMQGDHGGRVVLLLATPLDRPLAEAAPSAVEDPIAACGRALGLQVLSIADILSDQRVEDVRADPCCHLNARGHALLAERIAPQLAQLRADRGPARATILGVP